MLSYTQHFYEFISEAVEGYYGSIHHNDFERIKDKVSRAIRSIEPFPAIPFQFFKWFFSPKNLKADEALRGGGEELFVDFFNHYHRIAFRDSYISHEFSNDGLCQLISHYRNVQNEDYEIVKSKFEFAGMLVSILDFEYQRCLAQLNWDLKNQFNLDQVRNSLLGIKNHLSDLHKWNANLFKNSHNKIFQQHFEVYKSKITNFILENIPQSYGSDATIQLLPDDLKRFKIGKIRKFTIGGNQPVFDTDKTSFHDLVALFLEEDYSKKVYFRTAQKNAAFILEIIESIVGRMNLKKLCSNGCIMIFGDDMYYPAIAGNLASSKSKMRDEEKKLIRDRISVLWQ